MTKDEKELRDWRKREAEKMIDELRLFAEENDWFNIDFVESVADFLARTGSISEKQYEALDRLHERFCQ